MSVGELIALRCSECGEHYWAQSDKGFKCYRCNRYVDFRDLEFQDYETWGVDENGALAWFPTSDAHPFITQ
jgi:hypothetical protein